MAAGDFLMLGGIERGNLLLETLQLRRVILPVGGAPCRGRERDCEQQRDRRREAGATAKAGNQARDTRSVETTTQLPGLPLNCRYE
ncbi:MAG TPA: hypothetical protein VFX38_08235 [Gammaproteobacteria bacterium]|nr:hypothetical protein [Gammaproteobacteria bacterium]